MKREFIIAVLCFGIVMFGRLFASQAQAAILPVTDAQNTIASANDYNGDRSKREAIATADKIRFSLLSNALQTVPLSSRIITDKSLIVIGTGANFLTSDGAGTAAITNLTVVSAPISGTTNSYQALTAFSGTYTVGTGATFATLKAFFDAVNAGVVTGNIIVSITGNSTETATASLNQWTESPANSNFTMTIQPLGARTISGSLATSVIKLNGADRVTIDGLNTGGNSLAVINNRTTTNSAVIWLSSLGTGQGATNNTIRNLTLTGGTAGSNTVSTFGIIVGSTINLNTFGADNDNVTIQGNTITKVQNGIYVEGTNVFLEPVTSVGGDDNLSILNNIVGPATVVSANNIGATGILVQNAIAPNISGNTVRNVIAPTAFGFQGFPAGITLISATNGVIAQNTVTNVTHPTTTNAMWATGILSSQADGTQITGNVVSGVKATALNTSGNIVSAYGIINSSADAQIVGNTVTSVISSSTSGCPAYGIWLTNNISNITLANNSVSDIQSFSYSDTSFRWQPVGIYIDPFAQNLKLYYNSVNLFGARAGLNTDTMQAALFIGGSGYETGLDIRSNIFANTYDNSNSVTDKSYAIYTNALPSAFSNISFNDYYISGTPGILGAIATDTAGEAIDRTTITDWRAATGKDIQSFAANPLFTSATNLHINPATAATSPVSNAGTPITGITTDIDGGTRSATIPDIGADEFGITHFSVSAPVNATVGSAFNFTVTALDASNNIITGYTGTVYFTSTSAGMLPPDYTFAAGDNGAHIFSATLNTAGNQTITATDTGNAAITGTSGNINVVPASAPDLTITKTHTGNFSQGQMGVQYTIAVTNSGNASTTGTVTATDTLPFGLTATAIGGTGWSCDLGTLTCTRSNALAVGSSYPAITLTVNVAGSAPSSVTNTASVSGGGEINTANNTADDQTTVTSNTIVWTGATNVNWNAAVNWNPVSIPTAENDVSIPSSGVTREPTISDVDVIVNSLNESPGRTLTINSGRSLTVTNDCAFYGTVVVAGSFNCGSMEASGTVIFNGNAAQQTIPAGEYNNLTINNPFGVSLGGDVTITGTLTLTNGVVTTGEDKTLTIGFSGSISRASSSGYVIGSLQKQFSSELNKSTLSKNGFDNSTSLPNTPLYQAAPAAFVYPVGTANGISPVTVNAAGGGSFTVSAAQNFLPGVNTSQSIQRYWTLISSGVTQADITFKYLDADVPPGANESNFNFIRRSDSNNTSFTPTSFNITENTFTLNDVTQFSDWTLGTPASPTAATVSVAGRVLTPDGRGLQNATVVMIDASGNARTARTSTFGYYRFDEVETGRTYIFNVRSKRYQFAPQVVNLTEDLSELNFTGAN